MVLAQVDGKPRVRFDVKSPGTNTHHGTLIETGYPTPIPPVCREDPLLYLLGQVLDGNKSRDGTTNTFV